MYNLNKQKNKNRQGFTLIELVVSLGVFSLISVALVGLFVTSLRNEKRALNVQLIQDNARLVMETMVRELRDGSNVVFDNVQNISFRDKYGTLIKYSTGTCSLAGNANNNCIKRSIGGVAVDLGSGNVNITNLKFFGVASNVASNQPRVTIFFTAGSGIAPYQANINLQSTISLRNMEL